MNDRVNMPDWLKDVAKQIGVCVLEIADGGFLAYRELPIRDRNDVSPFGPALYKSHDPVLALCRAALGNNRDEAPVESGGGRLSGLPVREVDDLPTPEVRFGPSPLNEAYPFWVVYQALKSVLD